MKLFPIASLVVALFLSLTLASGQEKKDEKKKDDAAAKKEESTKTVKEELNKLKAQVKALEDEKTVTTLVTYVVGVGNPETLPKNRYVVFAGLTPARNTGLGCETHLGTQSGFLGIQAGWAVFGSKMTGSGLLTKQPRTVIFVPWNEDGSLGTPVLVEGNPVATGGENYVGDGPGFYFVAK